MKKEFDNVSYISNKGFRISWKCYDWESDLWKDNAYDFSRTIGRQQDLVPESQ